MYFSSSLYCSIDGPFPRWRLLKYWLKYMEKYLFRGWRDGSMVKSTACFSRGPGFDFSVPMWGLTTVCNLSTRRSNALSWLLQARNFMFEANLKSSVNSKPAKIIG